MAEENKNNGAANNQNPPSNGNESAVVRSNSGASGNTLNAAKKPKTARQIERERERRRRRRQNKANLDSKKADFQTLIPKKEELNNLNKSIPSENNLKVDLVETVQKKEIKAEKSVLTDKNLNIKENLPATQVSVNKEAEMQPEIAKLETIKPLDEPNSQISKEVAMEKTKDLAEKKQQNTEILPVTEPIVPPLDKSFAVSEDQSAKPVIIDNENQEKVKEFLEKNTDTPVNFNQNVETSNQPLAEISIEEPQHLMVNEEPAKTNLSEIEIADQSTEKPIEPLKNAPFQDHDNVVGSSYSSTADNWIPNLKKAEEQQVQQEEENHDDIQEIIPEEAPHEVPEDVQHEDYLQQTNQEKAKEIAKNLLGEESNHLDELPVKQGLFGKFFDWLSNQAKKKTSASKVEINVSSTEKNILSKLDFTKFWPLLKNILALFILIVVVVLAFWLGSSLKLYDQIMSWFAPKPGQEQLVQGDNNKVVYDAELLKKFGFETGRLFSINDGNIADLGYNMFFNANYFGKLKEPVFPGETGITAAIYYGFGKDIQFAKNRFVYYVKFLQKLNNAYSVNINDLLKGSLKRDEILNKYLIENKALFEEGNTYRKEINIQVDDLKISLNSITPDKDKSEADFFAFLTNLKGEQADINLQKFIEISQKQVEIKAKLAAMSKLAEYYLSILTKLKVRLDAIGKNQDALISGVQVIDIPEANLDLVKKNQ